MKQKRTKPRPTLPKKERWSSLSASDRNAELAHAEYLDWIGDVEEREYKKSDKFKQVQQLADTFKKRAK